MTISAESQQMFGLYRQLSTKTIPVTIKRNEYAELCLLKNGELEMVYRPAAEGGFVWKQRLQFHPACVEHIVLQRVCGLMRCFFVRQRGKGTLIANAVDFLLPYSGENYSHTFEGNKTA